RHARRGGAVMSSSNLTQPCTYLPIRGRVAGQHVIRPIRPFGPFGGPVAKRDTTPVQRRGRAFLLYSFLGWIGWIGWIRRYAATTSDRSNLEPRLARLDGLPPHIARARSHGAWPRSDWPVSNSSRRPAHLPTPARAWPPRPCRDHAAHMRAPINGCDE